MTTPESAEPGIRIYTFRTRRFEIVHEANSWMHYALLFRRPRSPSDWPICAAVDIRHKKSRQRLISELINERFVNAFIKNLMKGSSDDS